VSKKEGERQAQAGQYKPDVADDQVQANRWLLRLAWTQERRRKKQTPN
jgi:hypothetical protein